MIYLQNQEQFGEAAITHFGKITCNDTDNYDEMSKI